MKDKLLSIICLLIIILLMIFVFNTLNNYEYDDNSPANTTTYQGPVQPGYNEQHFRTTGDYERYKTKQDIYINMDDISNPNPPIYIRNKIGDFVKE